MPTATTVQAIQHSKVTCPACHSGETDYVFSVSAVEAAQHFVLREEHPDRHRDLERHIKVLWGKDTCDIRKCRDCQFGFADPFVAGDAHFYNLAYPRVNYPPSKWEYSATLAKLRDRTMLAHGDVLDVAAGFGFFLDKIKPLLGADQACFATEFNEDAIGNLTRKGYRVLQDDIRSHAFDGLAQRFAYMFLFQVVEHMDGLDELFARIRTLLIDGGSAFIAVPNSPRTDFQEQTSSLIDMPPNHIGRWTEAAFDAQARKAGLKLTSVEVEPFNIVNFAKVDLRFSHLKRAQQSGRLANRLRSLPNTRGRRLAEAALALAWAPARTPVILRAAGRGEGFGDSVLVELTR